jgi:hypothetical protein
MLVVFESEFFVSESEFGVWLVRKLTYMENILEDVKKVLKIKLVKMCRFNEQYVYSFGLLWGAHVHVPYHVRCWIMMLIYCLYFLSPTLDKDKIIA